MISDPSLGTCIAAEPYALQITDDSMAPELPRSSVVIIDPTAKIAPGALVLAEVNGELYVRQLRCAGTGYELVALDRMAPVLALDDGLSAVRGAVVQRAGHRRRYHKHYY